MKEFNNTLIWTGQKEWERWTGSNRCPNCGSDEIEYNTQLVLASYPPQSQLRCKRCGHHFSSGIASSPVRQDDFVDRTYLNEVFKHDQSIIGIPQVGDWPLAPTPCDPLPATDKTTMYGWICPKCGRALAPHLDSCPYCSGLTTINITCKGE